MALGASSFMLWLKFVFISWTCWILVQSNSVYVKFQDFWNKCSFLFGQLWELEIRLCGLEVGWAEVIRQTVPFLLVCVPNLRGGGWAGWAWSGIKCCSSSKIYVILIFHDHSHYSEIFLARFWISFVFNKAPLHLVFNKAATIVLNRISSLHIVWFSHINIFVVTNQMRDKTTWKVNKRLVTKVTPFFPTKIRRFLV